MDLRLAGLANLFLFSRASAPYVGWYAYCRREGMAYPMPATNTLPDEARTPTRVLIVDDEDDSRYMLKCYLEKEGCTVIEATDGYEAVEKAVAHPPDLIIMDMAMPLVDGVNSTRTMRLHDELSNVPIVVLTAFGKFYEPRAMDAGCTEVLHKPVDFGELEPIVRRYTHLS